MTFTLPGMEPRNPWAMIDKISTYVATLQPRTQYFPENQLLVDLRINYYQNQHRPELLTPTRYSCYTSFSPSLCPILFYFSRPHTSHRERAISMSRKLGRLTEVVSTYRAGGFCETHMYPLEVQAGNLASSFPVRKNLEKSDKLIWPHLVVQSVLPTTW